jgi:hypothetical protein
MSGRPDSPSTDQRPGPAKYVSNSSNTRSSAPAIIDPPDGKVPYTPEGRTRWDAVPKPLQARGADRPEDRDQAERCITTGAVMVPNPFYNNYHRIVQTPEYVVILTEMMHEARVIPLDGRPHAGPGVRLWLGDSRGPVGGTDSGGRNHQLQRSPALSGRDSGDARRGAFHAAR